MKFKKSTKLVSLICVILFGFSANAQIEDIITTGREDASKYLEGFLNPVFTGLVHNLNSGWYHSGKTHKLFGFDITMNVTGSFIPLKDETFEFRNSDYSYLTLQNGTSSEIPTVFGDNSSEVLDVIVPLDSAGNIIPQDLINNGTLPDSFRVGTIETLNGIAEDLPIDAIVPTGMIQVGFGLPKKTEIKFRFIPNVGTEDVETNLFGVGIQHNLLQHFKIADAIPLIDISLLAAFTKSKTTYTPEDVSGTISATNQEIELDVNAYTVQILGNVNLKIVNFYAGIGYASGDANLKVKGNYSVNGSNQATLVDPIDLGFDVDAGIRGTVGMRLNIAWFKVFADYSIQEYHTVNAGIAFSFR